MPTDAPTWEETTEQVPTWDDTSEVKAVAEKPLTKQIAEGFQRGQELVAPLTASMRIPGQLLDKAADYIFPSRKPLVPPETFKKIITGLTGGVEELGTTGEVVKDWTAEQLSGLTHPKVLLPAIIAKRFPVTRSPIGGYFAGATAESAPEAAQQIVQGVQEKDPEKAVRGTLGLAASVAIPAAIAKGLRTEIEPSGIKPTEEPPPIPTAPEVPAEAQGSVTATELPLKVAPEPILGQAIKSPEGARPHPRQELLDAIIAEGVKRKEAEALIAGTKTIKQVVDENLDMVVPSRDFSQLAATPESSFGHADAMEEGYRNAMARLAQLLETQKPPEAPPAPPAPETTITPPPPPESAPQAATVPPVEVPAFAQKYNPETLHQRPAWVEPGSAFDKVLGDLREQQDPFLDKDVTGIWKSLTPEQRQDLAARGWVAGGVRDPKVVTLHLANDSVAAKKFYGMQNRIAQRATVPPVATPDTVVEAKPLTPEAQATEQARLAAELGQEEAPPQGAGPGTGLGPGSALTGDVPAAPRQAIAAAGKIEQAPPEGRPLGPVSPMSIALNGMREAIGKIGVTLKGIAGESMPKTTKANRQVGESGVRYASSRIAAQPMARAFSAKVLEDTGVDPIKLGAALTEDNLQSIRESLRQKATELQSQGKEDLAAEATLQADNVATIIGSKGSPFETQDQYFDFLNDPATKKAIDRHIQMWQETIDPQYREAASIDPDVELPSRGQQTGARVNLNALFPEDPAAHPVKGMVGSNLTGTFKKKTPFATQAKGSGDAYDIDYHSIIQNTFNRQLEIANKNAFDNQLVDAGLAVIDKPGRQVSIGGKPAVGFPLARRMVVATGGGEAKTFSQARNIYVRQDLAREYRSAANVDPRFSIPVVTKVMNVINRAALSGLTDATVHVSNQMTALFNRPVSGKLFTDTLLSATGRADVVPTLIKAVSKAFKDNTHQISELAKIGALRPQDIHFGIFGRMLQRTDRITRLLLDDTFKSLVDQGLVENTETARREYVNQIGQYNRRLQGPMTKFLRDTGFGPFVTAGKTFNALGVKMATLSPGAKASGSFAEGALRANVLSKWIGGAVLLGTLNYLLTKDKKNGGVMGRPGTPIGSIDLGINDKSGKQLNFPLFSVLGIGRGLRVTGIGAAINAKRLGLTAADAAQSASRDIINSWTAPASGPPVKFGMISATGFPPAVNVGRASRVVPPGELQIAENVKEALRQSSPIVQSYIKYRQGKTTPEILASQLPRLSMVPGKSETMVEKYPKIVAMAQGNAFIEDIIYQARRLPKDERRKFVNEQIQRLPRQQREHARSEVTRRRVYTN